MADVCSFCLGGETDIPPFGDTKDAQDLIHPCTTCSLFTHRKCLLDWFNSLPSDKLHIVEGEEIDQELRRSRDDRINRNDHEIGTAPDNFNEIRINLGPGSISNWLNNLTDPVNTYFGANKKKLGQLLLLLAPCPQCKEDIMFSMKRSSLLSLNTGVRTSLSRGLQYTGVFLGLTSALTGVVSMGYIGLTSCGLKIMDCILPEPLLIRLLTKRSSQNSLSLLSSVLLGNGSRADGDGSHSIDNLETALSRGLIDPFKFSRIPILPIILYRMRQSSFISCLFSGKATESGPSNWITEILINGYISSMGNHELVRSVYDNFLSGITNIIRNPRDFYKYLNVFQGVDFWDVNNMISMLIPIRILYDLLFRLTINQLYFDITMKVRPRDIANNLPEKVYDQLEEVKNSLESIKLAMSNQTTQRRGSDHHRDFDMFKWGKSKLQMIKKLYKQNLVGKYVKLNIVLAALKLKACLKNDYSKTLLYNSFTIRCLTTIIWPFLSSKFSPMFYKLVFRNITDIPKDKLVFASNILSLVFVVFLKDMINLYLNYKKSKQLSQLSIINLDSLQEQWGLRPASRGEVPLDVQSHSTSIPGRFEL